MTDETGRTRSVADDGLPSERSLEEDRAWAEAQHDRTGEVELIISAAVLFGLFQAPAFLDGWFDGVAGRLGGRYFTGTFLIWYYTKLIVYTLIGSFSIHLLTRAYWIGLLGLDSAFPGGIRWERLRYGPLARREYQGRLTPVPTLARRADKVASTVFAAGFWIVLLFATSVALAAVASGVALALHRFVLPQARLGVIWTAVVGGVALIPAVFILIDRSMGDRLDPESLTARVIRAGVGNWFLAFAGPILLPIQFTLFTNLRRRYAYSAMVGVFGLLIGVFVVGERLRRGDWFVSPSEFFPSRTGALVANARYYENQDPDLAEGVPTIPSDVIKGPYVRLRVPFVARRDNARLREACPDLPTVSREGIVSTSDRTEAPEAEDATLLGCVAGLWAVRLNGEPLDPDWAFAAAGGNGISGLVAYLPTAELGAGAHVLEVVEVLAPPTVPSGEDEEKEPLRHFIRFWI